MSLGSRVAALEREVAELRSTVARLAAQLEDSEASSFDLVPASPGAPGPSTRGSALASPPRVQTPVFTPNSRAAASGSASPAGTFASSASSRGAACREIGLFLRRCLSGEHRGASGRDRLPGGSRFWVVARDYHGATFSPVQVFTRFGDCKQLVKIGSDLGLSVCIGLPARGDVIAVCAAADLALPAQW